MNTPSTTPALILFGQRLSALVASAVAIVPGALLVSANAVTKAVVFAYPAGTAQALIDQVTTMIAGFDWTQAGQTAWDDSQHPDFAAIRAQAVAAVQNNNAYVLIADTAVNTDVRAQVKALTQQNTQLIKTLGAVIVQLTGR